VLLEIAEVHAYDVARITFPVIRDLRGVRIVPTKGSQKVVLDPAIEEFSHG
jgi:hypothetical protein